MVKWRPVEKLHLHILQGKEFLGKHGTYHSTTITPEQQKVMFEFNMRMKQILKRPEYEKFALIGSGLQIKFAQVSSASPPDRSEISGWS